MHYLCAIMYESILRHISHIALFQHNKQENTLTFFFVQRSSMDFLKSFIYSFSERKKNVLPCYDMPCQHTIAVHNYAVEYYWSVITTMVDYDYDYMDF